MADIIRLENISFGYERGLILNHFNLNIEENSVVLLSGPNGCGKSTLLKIINGLRFPVDGHYYFDEEEITENILKDDSRRKLFHQRLGYVFQNPDVQLFCNNVYDEVAFGPRQMGLKETEIEKRVSDCLALMNIDESIWDCAPYHLSGGEKRRVAIASVLSINPEVIVFDEPTNDLDRESRKRLLSLLSYLKEAGKTIILVSHDPDVGSVVDHVVKM